jgi:hypothetical protein
MFSLLVITSATLILGADGAPPSDWKFDPNTLTLAAPELEILLRPVGDMHGVVIRKMADQPSPVVEGRAFLNLEHYLEKGRYGEYLPRKLDHTVTMNKNRLAIAFPQAKDWPVNSTLTYTWATPGAIDAQLDFEFRDEMNQFEVYFTSYFDAAYERSIRANQRWLRPEISEKEQLLIPRDDKIAGRFGDGRWEFLKGRIRMAEYRFDLPIIVSRNDATGWTVVQMVEPGKCTHIAPNRFARGHNFIIGGWDVAKGDRRSARVRLITGKDLGFDQVERAYATFADECRQQQTAHTNEKPTPATKPTEK